MQIEKIEFNCKNLAVIVRSCFHQEGLQFVTPDDAIIQMGYMSYAKGKEIQAHMHKPYRRETFGTQEVIFVKKGRVQVNFFSDEEEYVSSKILEMNDWLVLLSGGHSFEILEDAQMIEVKNGPYAGDQDKIRF
jgi:mannose-6-phosphate isomerase-like protein (cupin superfamily)